MVDIFQSHNKKQKLKDKLYFYAFYTLLLYLFALLIVSFGGNHQICLFKLVCAQSGEQLFLSALIVYAYLLFFVVLLIQTYKLMEKLVGHKNHIQYFKYIFFAIPVLITLLVWILETQQDDAIRIVLFASIVSVAGLLMIELRKK